MKKIRIFVLNSILLTALVACTTASHDSEVAAARRLLGRVAPAYEKHIRFERLADTATDRFELESLGRTLVIRGNNVNSMAVGLNHFLKYYCHAHYSWFADEPLELPATMPRVPTKVELNARVKNRFFLNYCTFGYTMPWWNWQQWEHFIDWMALNGVNLPLAITGQEAVWYEVWLDLGLSDEEIRSYFTGPAHLPWHRMQNIDRWGGPLPLSWLENQKALQKQIVNRERELAMRPVLPGFAGHVPPALRHIYPDAPLTPLGGWAGFDTSFQCYFLDPECPLYADIQKRFIDKQTEFFGSDHVYGIDVFNELDPPSWQPDYLARVSRQVYASLAAADSQACWLEMSWLFWNKRQHWEQDDRIEAYITSFPKERHLLLDYYCEQRPVWERTSSFFGVPFIWCYLGNFGGNSMLNGNLDSINSRIERAFASAGPNFAGIGSTLEGFDCNPFIYEFVFEKAWDNPLTLNTTAWVEYLADQRAGEFNPTLRAAWKLLADSVYNKVSSPSRTVRINRRPAMPAAQARPIAPTYAYGNINLLHALDLMLASDCRSRACRFDVVNVARQLLGNYFGDLFSDYVEAYYAGDRDRLRTLHGRMADVLDDTETLLASEPQFLLGRWLRDARALGATEAEKDFFECNARNIVTTWGEEDGILNDYASRGWAGLTASYYAFRWQEFFKAVEQASDSRSPFNAQAYHDSICRFEGRWWRNRIGSFSHTPRGDSFALASAIVKKYRNEWEARYSNN